MKIFRYVKAPQSTIYRTLTCFSVLLFLPLIQLLKCLCWFICRHNFTMKFPPDFHNRLLHLINRLKAVNLTDLQKWKKNIMWEVVAKRCSAKKLSKKLHKIHNKIPVLESLFNTVEGVQAVRLGTLLNINLCTGVLEPAVSKCFLK